MDSISNDNPTSPRLANKPSHHRTSADTSSGLNNPQQEIILKSSFSNLPKLAKAANQLTPDIRQEAIVRAKALLNDPSWLNEEDLEVLSSKIIQLENL